jgi:hypothetical protein
VRLILFLTLLALCPASTLRADTTLDTCLQSHLDAVFRGESVAQHLDVAMLAGEVGSSSHEAVSAVIATLLDAKVAKFAKRYRGTTVTTDANQPSSRTVTGSLTTPDGKIFRFTSTHGGNPCYIANLSIGRIFALESWLRKHRKIATITK